MFKIKAESGSARLGQLKTKSGRFETPFFMPAATMATGKCISTDDYDSIGLRNLICNALVLSMSPGVDVVGEVGGIHKFMKFDGCIFTDCGGFQMSRSMFKAKTKKGLHFESPFSGKKHVITPERIMRIHEMIGSDVAMALDDMAPYGANREVYISALKNTHKWMELSKKYHTDDKQLLFGIVQGGFQMDLRRISAHFINGLDFDGVAIGGLAIGEPAEEMYRVLNNVLPIIDKEKPRYVMGLGSPRDIVEAVGMGIDCFDSVYPTKNGRNGTLFTDSGNIDITKTRYAKDNKPIDPECGCFVCKNFSRAYMHHLMKIKEPVGKRYRSYHNLWYMQRLIERIREAIKEDRFEQFKKEFFKKK
ncbi:tRNA guanosine(34) transglycosylase Tgt [Candidatus Woesearchaeota archaeon]|nr:tRNA guanosine(34) transglycosylase Tgt [Candidatus Woesearchaeota archaeon]